MNKYRIVEKIDNTAQERESREHIIHTPKVEFLIEKKQFSFLGSYYVVIQRSHKTLREAEIAIEDLTGRFVTTKIHGVNLND